MSKINKSPTNGDIFINTKLYGIYNPKHFHSFQSTWSVFVPQVCAACNNPVYPFMQACVCLRCRLYCHRNCTRKQPTCSQFTFEHKVSGEQRRSFAHKDSRDGSSEIDLQLHKIVEKACMIPAVLGYLPEPQSHFCIWQSVLRAVAMRQNNHTTKPIVLSTKTIDLQNLEASIAPTILTLLKDTNHFAGQISMVCLFVFLSLDFLNAGHIIAHARECLDTVVNSVWNVCQIEVVHATTGVEIHRQERNDDEIHELILQAIAFTVERFMLQEKEGAMYDKIFIPIRMISRQFTYNQDISFPNRDTKRLREKTKEQWKTAKQKLLHAIAPIDKLRALVDILHIASNNKHFKFKEKRSSKKHRIITAAEMQAEENNTENTGTLALESPSPNDFVVEMLNASHGSVEDDEDDIEDGWKRYSSSDVEDESDDIFAQEDNYCDADTLLENLTILLLADMHPKKKKKRGMNSTNPKSVLNCPPISSGIPTDEAPQADPDTTHPATEAAESSPFTLLTNPPSIEMKEKGIDWLGECLYLSSPIISKAILDLNGMEGYALVTFQQVIQSLLTHQSSSILVPKQPLSHEYDTIGDAELLLIDNLTEIPDKHQNQPEHNESNEDWQQPIDFVSVNSFEKLWASVHHSETLQAMKM